MRQTNKLTLIIYNREQAANPHYDWTPENLPVTKLTGRNISKEAAKKRKEKTAKDKLSILATLSMTV